MVNILIILLILALIFITIFNALMHHLKNNKNLNKDFVSTYQTGRILNFKTGKTESQIGPIFSQ